MPKRKLFEYNNLSLFNDGTFIINSEEQKLEKEYLFKLFKVLEPILEDWNDYSISQLLEEINEKNLELEDLEIKIEDLESDIDELQRDKDDLEYEIEYLEEKLKKL